MNLPSGAGRGTLRGERYKRVIRSDNSLVFQSRRFRAMCRDYGLPQEFVTPSTPEQNGTIERFFRSLKEECVWLRNFRSFEEARREYTAPHSQQATNKTSWEGV